MSLVLRGFVIPAALGIAFAVLAASAVGATAGVGLSTVSPSETAAGATEVKLDFDGPAPKFSVEKNDNRIMEIGLEGASEPSRIKPQGLPTKILNDVFVSHPDTGLTLVFYSTTPAPVHVEAKQTGERQITLTFTRPSGGGASGGASGAAGDGPVAQGEDQGEFVVIPLKYADVSEVAGLLTTGKAIRPNSNFIAQEPAFGSLGANGLSSNAQAQANALQRDPNVIEPLGEQISDAVGIDRRLNAMILKGTPDQVARLKARVESLDQPVQSVILDTVFIELTKTGSRNLGLDLNNSTGQIAQVVYQSGAFLNGSPYAKSFGVNMQAAFAAQIAKGEGRIVSSPRISAQSGGTAKIVTGDAIPVITSITLAGVNGVSQQVQYVNVGVTLQIAPRVTADGFVSSQVFCVVSSVTGYRQGVPTISQREAATSATVQDGQSFMIGGLSQQTRLKTASSPPLLGDIPLLGALARSVSETTADTDLFILVTPHISAQTPPQTRHP